MKQRRINQLKEQIDTKKMEAIIYGCNLKITKEIQQMKRIKKKLEEQMKQTEKQMVSTVDNGTSEANPSFSHSKY